MPLAQPKLSRDGGTFEDPGWPRSMRWWTVTQWIIAINIAIFGIQLIAGEPIVGLGSFSVESALFRMQVWRWVTTAFLHKNVVHLVFNMWGLWIFGPVVEERLGRPRFLVFYLLGSLGGVMGYLILWRLKMLSVDEQTQLIGASACVFACMVAAAHLSPYRRIRFIFPPVTLNLKTVAWICVALALVVIVQRGENAGGEAAHLGGAAVGLVLVRNIEWLDIVRARPRRQRFWRPGDPASNFFRHDA